MSSGNSSDIMKIS